MPSGLTPSEPPAWQGPLVGSFPYVLLGKVREGLVPGGKPRCDFSGLTISNYKGFPWQASQGKATPHSRLGTQPACACLRRGLWLEIQDPLACGAFSHVYIPSRGAFIPRSSSEAFSQVSSVPSTKDFLVRELDGTPNTAFPVLPQYPVLFHSSSFPSHSLRSQDHKTTRAFCASFPQRLLFRLSLEWLQQPLTIITQVQYFISSCNLVIFQFYHSFFVYWLESLHQLFGSSKILVTQER